MAVYTLRCRAVTGVSVSHDSTTCLHEPCLCTRTRTRGKNAFLLGGKRSSVKARNSNSQK